MKEYDCLITDKINKNLISAVLERKVIETIIEKNRRLFNCEEVGNNDEKDGDEQRPNLEAKILNTTDKLLEMAEIFSKIRIGTDKVSKAVPIKLRQQVCATLGNRGFSKTEEHPLIVKLRNDIIYLMNRYRRFRDPRRLKEYEKMINESY